MRLSLILLLLALAGMLGGGALISVMPGLGACLILESAAAGAYALFRDVPERAPGRHEAPTLPQVLERALRS